jgi:hypothetical protein
LFEYLQNLEKECNGNEDLFVQRLSFFRNLELQTIIKEIQEQSNESSRRPKCAKGTRDMTPLQMAIREKAFE